MIKTVSGLTDDYIWLQSQTFPVAKKVQVLVGRFLQKALASSCWIELAGLLLAFLVVIKVDLVCLVVYFNGDQSSLKYE